MNNWQYNWWETLFLRTGLVVFLFFCGAKVKAQQPGFQLGRDVECIISRELFFVDMTATFPEPTQAYSAVVCYNPALTSNGAEPHTIIELVGETPADFVSVAEIPEDFAILIGYLQDFNLQVTIPPGDYRLAELAFFAPADPGEVGIRFCDLDQRDPPIFNTVTVGFEDRVPTFTNLVLTVDIPFMRGDPNNSGRPTIADAIVIMGVAMGTRTIGCLAAADLDKDLNIDMTDAVMQLAWIFQMMAPPDEPISSCGIDPDPTLTCNNYVCP